MAAKVLQLFPLPSALYLPVEVAQRRDLSSLAKVAMALMCDDAIASVEDISALVSRGLTAGQRWKRYPAAVQLVLETLIDAGVVYESRGHLRWNRSNDDLLIFRDLVGRHTETSVLLVAAIFRRAGGRLGASAPMRLGDLAADVGLVTGSIKDPLRDLVRRGIVRRTLGSVPKSNHYAVNPQRRWAGHSVECPAQGDRDDGLRYLIPDPNQP